jgi:hypothetical protein
LLTNGAKANQQPSGAGDLAEIDLSPLFAGLSR